MSSPAREAITGALAGAFSLAATYPLYTIVVHVQVKRKRADSGVLDDQSSRKVRGNRSPAVTVFTVASDLLRERGWRGFYRGLRAALVAVFVQSGVYYWFYEAFRAWQGVAAEPLWHVLLGFEAGVATTLLTNPLWVVNSRQMTESKAQMSKAKDRGRRNSAAEVLQELVQDEGLGGLFSGVVPALVLCSNPAIQFGSAQAIERRLERVPVLRSRANARAFLVGGSSKMIATVLTYPLQTAKLCLQKSEEDNGDFLFRGPTHVMMHILRTEGFRGWFRGLGMKLFQTVLTAALLSSFKNQLSNAVSILMVKRLLHRVRSAVPSPNADQFLSLPTPRPLRNW